ncbi:Protein SKT5 [Smittium mucronatum]|uniref:Protein SKT5 n=1 Tax=Smittium mucronatum TaxID=133383 RepID=A0A1R0H4G6_9FUNG|nr:Protein SKT5 [Smittium mucronatum]
MDGPVTIHTAGTRINFFAEKNDIYKLKSTPSMHTDKSSDSDPDTAINSPKSSSGSGNVEMLKSKKNECGGITMLTDYDCSHECEDSAVSLGCGDSSGKCESVTSKEKIANHRKDKLAGTLKKKSHKRKNVVNELNRKSDGYSLANKNKNKRDLTEDREEFEETVMLKAPVSPEKTKEPSIISNQMAIESTDADFIKDKFLNSDQVICDLKLVKPKISIAGSTSSREIRKSVFISNDVLETPKYGDKSNIEKIVGVAAPKTSISQGPNLDFDSNLHKAKKNAVHVSLNDTSSNLLNRRKSGGKGGYPCSNPRKVSVISLNTRNRAKKSTVSLKGSKINDLLKDPTKRINSELIKKNSVYSQTNREPASLSIVLQQPGKSVYRESVIFRSGISNSLVSDTELLKAYRANAIKSKSLETQFTFAKLLIQTVKQLSLSSSIDCDPCLLSREMNSGISINNTTHDIKLTRNTSLFKNSNYSQINTSASRNYSSEVICADPEKLPKDSCLNLTNKKSPGSKIPDDYHLDARQLRENESSLQFKERVLNKPTTSNEIISVIEPKKIEIHPEELYSGQKKETDPKFINQISRKKSLISRIFGFVFRKSGGSKNLQSPDAQKPNITINNPFYNQSPLQAPPKSSLPPARKKIDLDYVKRNYTFVFGKYKNSTKRTPVNENVSLRETETQGSNRPNGQTSSNISTTSFKSFANQNNRSLFSGAETQANNRLSSAHNLGGASFVDVSTTTLLELRDEAVYWIKKLERANVVEAKFIYATWLANGEFGLEKSASSANNYFMHAAKYHHPMANYRVGRFYEEKRIYSRCVAYYNVAASLDNQEANCRLGMGYLAGDLGLSRNIKLAIGHLKRALVSSSPEPTGWHASGNRNNAYTGSRYSSGFPSANPSRNSSIIDFRNSSMTAFEFNSAILAGKKLATTNRAQLHCAYVLGIMYLGDYPSKDIYGHVLKDVDEALRLLTLAAINGYSKSQYKLGSCYESGKFGVSPDRQLSLHYYKMAAKNGHKIAQLSLSSLYLVGVDGVLPPDEKLAFHWCQQSATVLVQSKTKKRTRRRIKADIDGIFDLGFIESLEEIESEYHYAQFGLGHFYEFGIGTEKDEDMGIYWYKRAAYNGNTDAIKKLASKKLKVPFRKGLFIKRKVKID